MKPRGFFSPDSSVSSACSVPMPPPPPPPFMPAPMICLLRRASGSSSMPDSSPAGRAATARPATGRRSRGSRPGAAPGSPRSAPRGKPGPPWASAPRRPSESASSKKTITPPYRSASRRSLRNSDFTLRMPTPKNMLMNAPGSTNTYGLPVSPGHRLGHQRLAGARRPPEQDAAGHVAAPGLDLLRVLQVEDVLLDPLQHVVLAPDVGEPGLDVVRVVHVDAAPGQEPEQRAQTGARRRTAVDELEHERQRVPDVGGRG